MEQLVTTLERWSAYMDVTGMVGGAGGSTRRMSRLLCPDRLVVMETAEVIVGESRGGGGGGDGGEGIVPGMSISGEGTGGGDDEESGGANMGWHLAMRLRGGWRAPQIARCRSSDAEKE